MAMRKSCAGSAESPVTFLSAGDYVNVILKMQERHSRFLNELAKYL
jgi:hypothetical protein